MDSQTDKEYYVNRKTELLKGFDDESRCWRPFIAGQFGIKFADAVMKTARDQFEALIPQIPYIGGEENHNTSSLVDSVVFLAFYQAMQQHGRTAAETGKILYDAILSRVDESSPPALEPRDLTTEQLMERRRKDAERSQERRYPGDYVFSFVAGDGEDFDYGYDFTECATQKFYHAQDADEFMPFYCFLDFAWSQVYRMGMRRTTTLAEGYNKCNHRFKQGRATELAWPPPFIKR